MSVAVRRIEERDWALAKAIRLRALANAPDAFAATLAEEEALDETRWRERTRSNAEGSSSVGFFALCDGVETGLVVGARSATASDSVELNALWVAPEARGRGAASALVLAVCEWGLARDARSVTLEVTETSRAAIALYRKLGFELVEQLGVTSSIPHCNTFQ